MSITFYEKVESREFTVSDQDRTYTVNYLVFGSENEQYVYEQVRFETPTVYQGMVRSSIKLTPRGYPGYWDLTVDYKTVVIDPPAAPEPGEYLGPNFSFRTSGGTTKITQSLETISRTRRAGAAKNHKQAIGVTKDGVEGCEIISRSPEISIELRMPFVTMDHFDVWNELTGKVNADKFLGFHAGEVLYGGADARSNNAESWTVTHTFLLSANKANIVISDEITVPEKKGWEYIWVEYSESVVGGNRIRRPEQANVEKVYETANFVALLGFGG